MADKKNAVEPVPPSKTWVLSPPVHMGQKEYDHLTMRAPTLNEVELTDTEDTVMKQIRKLTQLVSGFPPGVIDQVPFYILREAYAYTQSFTSEGVAAFYAVKS